MTKIKLTHRGANHEINLARLPLESQKYLLEQGLRTYLEDSLAAGVPANAALAKLHILPAANNPR